MGEKREGALLIIGKISRNSGRDSVYYLPHSGCLKSVSTRIVGSSRDIPASGRLHGIMVIWA